MIKFKTNAVYTAKNSATGVHGQVLLGIDVKKQKVLCKEGGLQPFKIFKNFSFSRLRTIKEEQMLAKFSTLQFN